MSRKVCVVTGTRAEYGLLYWLMKAIQNDPSLVLQVVVTGMHLSPEFGLTYKEIEKDFKIDRKIEILLSSDTPIGISKSMGLAQISFAEVFDNLAPNIVVVQGDRFEILAAALAATIARIPIAHIHGGETTYGSIDEPIRHSLTKMSHLHFASAEIYRKRIIQLGEHPKFVFNFGPSGQDNFKKISFLSKTELEQSLNFKFNKRNLIVTFHPVTLEKDTAEYQFAQLLHALELLEDTNIIFTKANADTEGRIINKMIDHFVTACPEKRIAFVSMGQLRYLSTLQFVDAVVGNSSSGIAEAPAFKIGTINIGNRQAGRVMAESIICCEPQRDCILDAFNLLYSTEFQNKLRSMGDIYGKEEVSSKVMQVLRDWPLDNILKKEFYDLKVEV